MTGEMVNIGKILKTHGYRGEVKVLPLTDFPERFEGMEQVWVEGPGKKGFLRIEYYRSHGGYLLFKFRGFDSKEQAACLVNGFLQVREEEVHPLPAGTYYVFQLVGLDVYDQEIGYLGKIKYIIETGANDVYVVTGPEYEEVLLPAIKQVVLGVDLEEGIMQVRLLPGLLEMGRKRR